MGPSLCCMVGLTQSRRERLPVVTLSSMGRHRGGEESSGSGGRGRHSCRAAFTFQPMLIRPLFDECIDERPRRRDRRAASSRAVTNRAGLWTEGVGSGPPRRCSCERENRPLENDSLHYIKPSALPIYFEAADTSRDGGRRTAGGAVSNLQEDCLAAGSRTSPHLGISHCQPGMFPAVALGKTSHDRSSTV